MKLPESWIETKIGEVVDFQGGTQPPKSTFVYEPTPGYVRMIQTRDYRTDEYMTYIPERLAKNYCHVDDVLIGRYGPPVFQIFRGLSGAYNVALIKAVPDEARITKSFLYLILLQDDLFKLIDGLSRRSAGQAGVDMPALRSFPLLLPPLSEQASITCLVDVWDRGIRQLADLIAAKLRLKQGLMQQLLTGKRRFKGFNREWKHVRIGDVAREISERNPDGDTIPVLSCTKYDGLVDSLEYFGKRVFSENTDNYKVVRRNDFAYATNHIEEGSIGLLRHAEAGLVSPMYTVFRTNGDVNPDYLYRVLKTETLRQVFASFTSASVNRRGSLRWKQFSTIPLELPGVEEQSYINNVMAAFDLEVALLRKQLDAFKQQKKGLMRKLLTGQVQVSLEKHMTQEYGSPTS